MSIPSFEQLMLPVLRLAEHREVQLKEAVAEISDQLQLSSEDRKEMLPGGKLKIYDRVSWAKTFLSKAMLLKSPRRGWFVITDQGKALLARKPHAISAKLLKSLVPDSVNNDFWYSNSTSAKAVVVDEASETDTGVSSESERGDLSENTPEQAIADAQKQLDAALREDIIGRILEQSPEFFERLVIKVMVAMGYAGTHTSAAKHTGGPGDGGIDGMIDSDRLGLDRVYLQAKRYAVGNNVSSSDIDGFIGALYGKNAKKGVFITTSSFSLSARTKVDNLSMRVALIDGTMLADLMIEHNVGVQIERKIEIKRLDADFFDDFA